MENGPGFGEDWSMMLDYIKKDNVEALGRLLNKTRDLDGLFEYGVESRAYKSPVYIASKVSLILSSL